VSLGLWIGVKTLEEHRETEEGKDFPVPPKVIMLGTGI